MTTVPKRRALAPLAPLALFAVLFAALFAVIGCAKIKQQIKLNKDGSGRFSMTIALDTAKIQELEEIMGGMMGGGMGGGMGVGMGGGMSPLKDLDIDKFKKIAKVNKHIRVISSETIQNEATGTVTHKAVFEFDSLKDLFESGLVTNVAAKLEKLENGDYQLTYRASAGKDLDGTPEMEELNEIGLMMMEPVLSDFEMSNQVEVPTTIVETNGTKSGERTATWTLDFKNMAKSSSRLQTVTFKGEGLDWKVFDVTAESAKKARKKAQQEADAQEKEAAEAKGAGGAVTPR